MTKLKLDTPFSVEVGSRIARASHGVICEEIWDDNVHFYPQDKTFDPILRKDVSIKVMKWHIDQVRHPEKSIRIDQFLTFTSPDHQGQDILVDCHPSFKFTKFLSEPPKKIETDIYKSLSDNPPKRQDDSVIKEYKLTWKAQVDWEALDVFVNDQGKTFRKLEYTVEMKCSAGTTVFYIYHGGYKQASKNVVLEFYETADI